MEELDWEGGAGLRVEQLVWDGEVGLGMEELDWGWEELDWGWEELPVSSGTLAGLISLGFHCCLIFKYRYILCNICHIFIFQSDSLSEIQMGF